MYFPLDTLPPSFPVITIDTLDESNVTAGNIFLSPSGSNCITIVDNSGNPQFVREIPGNGIQDFTVISPGRLSYFQLEGLPRGNLYLAVLYVLNDHYQVIDTFRCGNGYSTDDHDFRLLPNGHALLVGYDIRDTDLRIITGDSNAAKNATVIGGIIQELDIHKNVVFQWRTWDHLQISDVANYDLTDPNNTVVDYAHLNSIEPDTDGNIIASFRAMDNIVKIRRDSQGAIIWRWGGKNRAINNFTFIGDTLPFSSQHDVRRIANGHITMWDNGNYRKTIWGDGSYHDTSYSRAIEYNLDENLHTATAVWQYGNVPYSFAAGNVQRLPNGNTFIGLGAQNLPNAVEVTPEGKKVFQLSLPKNPLNYRTLRFQWPQPVSVYQLPGSAYSSELREIYPNPAGNLTTVIFSGEKAEIVHFDVINISGTSVLSLTDEIPEAGVYSLRLDVQNVSDGSYFCRFIQNGKISVKPFIVHK